MFIEDLLEAIKWTLYPHEVNFDSYDVRLGMQCVVVYLTTSPNCQTETHGVVKCILLL